MIKHREGTYLECLLPDHYDERTRIAKFPIGIVVVHPDHPPMYIKDGKLHLLEPYDGN